MAGCSHERSDVPEHSLMVSDVSGALARLNGSHYFPTMLFLMLGYPLLDAYSLERIQWRRRVEMGDQR